jgi:hypothetical protein
VDKVLLGTNTSLDVDGDVLDNRVSLLMLDVVVVSLAVVVSPAILVSLPVLVSCVSLAVVVSEDSSSRVCISPSISVKNTV